MDERGLWKLFFATGLPEAYLALAGQRPERFLQREEPAETAFRPNRKEV